MFLRSRLQHIRENQSAKWIVLRIFMFTGLALFSVAPAAYLSELGVSDSKIGFAFSIISLFVIITSFFFAYPLEKNNQIKVYTYAVFILFVSHVGMAVWPYAFAFLMFYSLTRLTGVIRNGIENIQFRDVTPQQEYTRLRSLLASLGNISWIVMPALGGALLTYFGYQTLFLIVAYIFAITLFISFYLKPHDMGKVRQQYDRNIKENILFFLKKKHLLLAFWLNFGRALWYVFLFIYLPLYLLKIGYSMTQVGYAITATQIPLVFVQAKISPVVKRFGFRKLFITSFLVLSIISMLLFTTQNIIPILLLLLLSGIVIGYLEVLPEVYYFKQVSSLEEEKSYFIFSSSQTIATILGGALFGGALMLITINQLFIVVAITMAAFTGLSIFTKDYRE